MSLFPAIPSGFYTSEQLDIQSYHRDAALGSSSLKTLITKTPAHLKYAVYPEKPHLVFGAAVHSLILEPKEDGRIVRGPEDRRGKKWSELKEQCDLENKLLLTSGDYDDAMRVRDSVLSNDLCLSLLTGEIHAESSVFADDHEHGLRVKCRPDLVNLTIGTIIDLKTTICASPDYFAKSVKTWNWHVQVAHYESVWRLWHGQVFDSFIFVAIERTAPFLVALYELDKATILEGYRLRNRAIDIYKKCKESDDWYGYSPRVETISIPNYAFETLDPETGEMFEGEYA